MTFRGGALLIAGLLVVSTADAQAAEQRRAAYVDRLEKRRAIEERIAATRPRRRDAPLRYLNTSDEEAREVKAIVAELLPRSIVNIGPVVTGCPCEEGLQCTDQVWVTLEQRHTSTGLLLSKSGGHWQIGPIQRWWLEMEAIERRSHSLASYTKYFEAKDRLIDAFPACSAEQLKRAMARHSSPAPD